MRISDWSSDVCSSDLHARRFPPGQMNGGGEAERIGQAVPVPNVARPRDRAFTVVAGRVRTAEEPTHPTELASGEDHRVGDERGLGRSEERRVGNAWVRTWSSWGAASN